MAEAAQDELTVVVIAGAAARGAYEAGAMAKVLPRLLPDLRNTLFLGTSAGAINAVLWASRAAEGKPLEEVGEEVCDVWRSLTADRVYALPKPFLRSKALRSLPLVPRILDKLGIEKEMVALLDTTPLWHTARELLDPSVLRRNVERGVVKGVGVVATSVPDNASGGRSRVFLDTSLPDPIVSLSHRAIDIVRTPVAHDHVLASAAIPALFPARMVHEPSSHSGYYVDGGVRLNAPLAPALSLGATRLIIISSHPETYGTEGATCQVPDVLQVSAQAIHVVLGDALIEDLVQLRRLNGFLQEASLKHSDGNPFRRVPHLVVAPPADEGQLAKIAADTRGAMGGYYHTALLRMLLSFIGEGTGGDELLSFLRFDPPYMNELIELGKQHAEGTDFRY